MTTSAYPHSPRLSRLKLALGAAVSLAAGLASAAPPAAPPGLDQLPPGRMKARIASLPPAAQQRAIEWLARFAIPVQDYPHLEVDNQGAVFYVDSAQDKLPAESSAPELDGPFAAGTLSQSDTFALHSNPGATRVIYLDFDGHQISNTAWNSNVSTYHAKPFDRDGAPYSFSPAELADIANIWHRIAEDYAAFDVDVTTELPASFGARTGRVLITSNMDENGQAMPSSGAGGVAYVGVFGESYYPQYQPALVYYNNLGGGAPRYVAEAASHEMGHNLGLSHDGTSTQSYYGGQGSGLTKWAPIMGNSYNGQVTQWSRGEYTDASNTQDDVAILAGRLLYRGDDHGNSMAAASLLRVDGDNRVRSSNPETDPDRLDAANQGILSDRADVDYFVFDTAGGVISLTATPAWAAYTETVRGANLDIRLELRDLGGMLLTSADPTGDTAATLNTSVAAGTYYLVVSGVGEGSTYSDYGSQGMYFLSGTVPAGLPVNTAPIAMDDNVSTDAGQSVSVAVLGNDRDPEGSALQITAFSQGNGGAVSLTNNQLMYTPAPGFSGVDTFTYTIADEGGLSAQAGVTITVRPVETVRAPEVPAAFISIDGQDGSALLGWDDTANESGYEIQREFLHNKNGSWRGTAVIATTAAEVTSHVDRSGSGTFRYRIRAFNVAGSSVWSSWTEQTVSDLRSGGTTGGSGKPGKR